LILQEATSNPLALSHPVREGFVYESSSSSSSSSSQSRTQIMKTHFEDEQEDENEEDLKMPTLNYLLPFD
jgi:hypothetical protein